MKNTQDKLNELTLIANHFDKVPDVKKSYFEGLREMLLQKPSAAEINQFYENHLQHISYTLSALKNEHNLIPVAPPAPGGTTTNNTTNPSTTSATPSDPTASIQQSLASLFPKQSGTTTVTSGATAATGLITMILQGISTLGGNLSGFSPQGIHDWNEGLWTATKEISNVLGGLFGGANSSPWGTLALLIGAGSLVYMISQKGIGSVLSTGGIATIVGTLIFGAIASTIAGQVEQGAASQIAQETGKSPEAEIRIGG